jgi:hypothetical protein
VTVESDPTNPITIKLSERFGEGLADAQLLLRYAAESGIDVPADIVEPIILATNARNAGVWTDAALQDFFSAFTRLAALLKPVTIASLKTSQEAVIKQVRSYRHWGLFLTLATVVLSLINFVNTGISEHISRGIEENNTLAAALRADLGPADVQLPNAVDDPTKACTITPGDPIATDTNRAVKELDTITRLQRFAQVLRDIDSRAVKLNWFVFLFEARPPLVRDQLQLDPQLADFHKAAFCKIGVYQEVRNFAQNVLADDAVLYGALSAYLLPVLYAVLGAFSYQIRIFTSEIRTRSFVENRANSARIIAAVVAGSIVSLFNGFTQGAALSPLAVAFLVGYGVEIFYAFLDRLVATFAAAQPEPALRAPPGPKLSLRNRRGRAAAEPRSQPEPVAGAARK